jgi:hypothetical protein
METPRTIKDIDLEAIRLYRNPARSERNYHRHKIRDFSQHIELVKTQNRFDGYAEVCESYLT